MNNFTPSRLARLAYHAMVENAARIQKAFVKAKKKVTKAKKK